MASLLAVGIKVALQLDSHYAVYFLRLLCSTHIGCSFKKNGRQAAKACLPFFICRKRKITGWKEPPKYRQDT